MTSPLSTLRRALMEERLFVLVGWFSLCQPRPRLVIVSGQELSPPHPSLRSGIAGAIRTCMPFSFSTGTME